MPFAFNKNKYSKRQKNLAKAVRMKTISLLVIIWLNFGVSYSQPLSQAQIDRYENKLKRYFLQDKFERAERAYQWLWMNRPVHDSQYYQTGLLLYDYLLMESEIKRKNHYQEMLDTLKTLTEMDVESAYDRQFEKHNHHIDEEKYHAPSSVVENDYDIAPSYPGGMEALTTYLHGKLDNTELSKYHGKSVRVFVEFIVKANGKIDDVRMLRGISPEVDAQIIEALYSVPAWTPAQKVGKFVPVKMILPINMVRR